MAGTAAWLHQWGGQLAGLAEEIKEKVPEGDDWNSLRQFLQNVQGSFRSGDIRAGVKALYKIMPFVQRAVSNTEKVVNIDSTYKVTETITQHFLVDDAAREEIEAFMKLVKTKVKEVKTKVEQFACELDDILDDVMTHGKEVSIVTSLRLAFQMNRISAHIRGTEEHLKQVRAMIDDLDSHVTTKSSMASLLSFLAFIFGLVFTSSGNLPLSAVCFTAASASRKSAQSLQQYRSQLAAIDKEHIHFQTEMKEWKHHFRAEQINFLLLIGGRKLLIWLLALLAFFIFMGKAANFMVFASFVLFLLYKCEQTNEKRYYVFLGLAALAAITQTQQQHGLAFFNAINIVLLSLFSMGFLDL